jgi:mannose-6-phosphate isomerase-like protein (cupin superfamily)
MWQALSINLKRFLAYAVLALASAAAATGPTVLSPERMTQILRDLPKIPNGNQTLVDAPHHRVIVARVIDRDGGPEYHTASDDVFYVLSGSAKLRLGGRLIEPRENPPGEFTAKTSEGWKEVPLTPGSVISVPRGTVHQVLAHGSDVTYLVFKAR